MPLTPTDTPDFPPIRRRGNGRFSAHTGRMDKNGVPKEAQDDALSDDTTGGRQTPAGRPTRGNVAPFTVFFFVFVFVPSREVEF